MKILLTLNKTYRGLPDSGYWYAYSPLKELGHEVYWYDTVAPEEKDYDKILEEFKPDLVWCCFTNNRGIAPYEPWENIKTETKKGRTKTYNWFCDDSWRFDNFSSFACQYFSVCSTPELAYIEKYKEIGYNNIILGAWHANSKFYPVKQFSEKNIEISFIGAPSPARDMFFDHVEVPVQRIFGVSQEELFKTHSDTKIGLNLAHNINDPKKKKQIKQRVFEVAAGGGLLLTEHHDEIEKFFEIGKEIVTFKTPLECSEKAKVLLQRPKIVEQISAASHKRFLKEHDSKIRLAKILEEIGKI